MLSYLVFFACIVLILGVLTLALNLQWGFTGVFNAGVVGFYAIGAYTHAILTAAPQPQYVGNFGLPWLVGVLAAMAATALASWLIGLVTIRLRGDYLAIATFGVAVSIQLVTLNWERLTAAPGAHAHRQAARRLFDTPFAFNLWFLGLMVVVMALVYWALERILRSPWGRVLRAIREDETAAIALGKSARRFRLEAFVLGSALMGPRRRALRQLHRLRQPVRLPADRHVPGLGHADRGRQRQQPRRPARRAGRVGDLGGLRRAGQQARAAEPAAQGAAIQVILIGLLLMLALLFRPRGLIGEAAVVSRHVDD
jgi:branched-chain amino acid transport system permease protein